VLSKALALTGRARVGAAQAGLKAGQTANAPVDCGACDLSDPVRVCESSFIDITVITACFSIDRPQVDASAAIYFKRYA
jgi:hypothetical protein